MKSYDAIIIGAGQAGAPATFRINALSLTDGRRTELVRGDLPPLCCMYAGITGNEFLYRTLHGNRVRLHAIRVGGASRLIGEIPAAAIGGAAVFQSRIVYVEPAKDSARLQLVTGTGRPPVTLVAASR